MYNIPLSCGQSYVGQTGRCLNVRLLEHNQKVKKGGDGFLAAHCAECKCVPLFDSTTVLATHPKDSTRLIIEAAAIANGSCISKPSIALTKKELDYLNSPARVAPA